MKIANRVVWGGACVLFLRWWREKVRKLFLTERDCAM